MALLIKNNGFGGNIQPPANVGDSGYDLFASAPATIRPNETVLVDTGVCAAIDENVLQYLDGLGLATDLQVRPRSSMSEKGLLMPIGTIDSGYTGNLKVVITNTTEKPYTIKAGDKIAQLVLGIRLTTLPLTYVNSLPETQRGEGGFGSTDSKTNLNIF